jgi:cyanate permease
LPRFWIDIRGYRAGLASGIAIGVAGALLRLIPSPPAIVCGLAMVAAGAFVSQATASSYIGRVTTEDRGLAVGLYSSCYHAGEAWAGRCPPSSGAPAAGPRASHWSSPRSSRPRRLR